MTNTLIEQLEKVCRDRLCEEKWLVAGSRRIAHQWLDRVARRPAPVVNVRVTTPISMALHLLAEPLAAGRFALASPAARRLIVGAAWAEAMAPGRGYLGDVRITPRLLALTERTISDLRMAGVRPDDLDDGVFEDTRKGGELRALLAAYEAELQRRRLIDAAEALRLAAAGSRGAGGPILLLPESLRLSPRERELVGSFPAERRVTLAEDEPGGAFEARQDRTLDIVSAVGEANEVRQALRLCLSEGIALDEVELLYTQQSPYATLVLEIAQRVLPLEPKLELGVPVTFAEGVAARASRPGRLLSAWLEWIRDDFPQSTLLRMLEAGLLATPASGLARALRGVAVGFKRQRYAGCLRGHAEGLARRLDEREARAAGEDDADPGRTDRLRRRLAEARALLELIERLVGASPPIDADAATAVGAALRLLREHARVTGPLDALARQHLVEELESMAAALAGGAPPGFDAWDWLEELPGRLRVAGSGPRPGHLHVASLQGGGQTGRANTFIVGLDDRRFPPAGLPDPLLLDGERAALPGELPPSSRRVREAMDDARRVLAGLRGRVTLGFCARDVTEDAETFAGPLVLAAFRILSGNPAGDHADLAEWLGPPASFAPAGEPRCLDAAEWWLCRGADEPRPANLGGLLGATYANLARGAIAAAQRASDAFTAFDGLIERPDPWLDPAAPGGPILSATGLQTLGACPLRYFYARVLRLEVLEDRAVDPQRWLDHREFGILMHEALYEFVGALIAEDAWPPEPARDRPRLDGILAAHVNRWKDVVPPPNDEALRIQVDELDRAAHIFLTEQAHAGARHRPAFLEAAIGLPATGAGTAIDTAEPVSLALDDGATVRARARLDRVDREAGDTPAFSICDYKSGRMTNKYEPEDRFDQGRLVQHALYMAVAQSVLRAHFGEAAAVTGFRFLFPSHGAGKTVPYGPEVVAPGLGVIRRLCTLPAHGAFPATDEIRDCRYCDYRPACWGAGRKLATVCEASARKKSGSGDERLKPFGELRP